MGGLEGVTKNGQQTTVSVSARTVRRIVAASRSANGDAAPVLDPDDLDHNQLLEAVTVAHGQALAQGNVAGQPAAIKLTADLIERRPEDPTESEFEKMTARILSDED